jgi:predicted RNA binding protein YcfA (HicA-like mRNA interferase family)
MPKITPINWKKFEKFLIFIGCEFKREKGDHRIYWREGINRPIVLPRETQLPVFIIRNNLRTLRMSPKEYIEILKRL